MVSIVEQKVKKKYTIIVEGYAPIKVEFQTFAYNDEEALEQSNNPRLLELRQKPDIDLSRIQKKKITLKETYTSLVKYIKNF